MRTEFEALEEFLPAEGYECEVVVAHPTTEWISESEWKALFDGASIEVSNLEIPEIEQETLFLFQNGEIVASSPVTSLTDVLAETNAMIRARTVTSPDSIELPSVLTALDEVPFAASGSSVSSLKLLFTTITRCIEANAVKTGNGQLRAGFQRLSRLDKAKRNTTRAIYEHLAETEVDVHVYGKPDWVPPGSLEMTIHGGYTEDFLRNWFVVYRSADDATKIAFTAHDYEKGGWSGHWTSDSDRVRQINCYLEQQL